jgi:hypothetical protein
MDITVIGPFLFATMMFVVSRVIKAIGYGDLEVVVEFAPGWALDTALRRLYGSPHTYAAR